MQLGFRFPQGLSPWGIKPRCGAPSRVRAPSSLHRLHAFNPEEEGALTPEEESFLLARVEQRRAGRKAAIQDAKRRANFDPASGSPNQPQQGGTAQVEAKEASVVQAAAAQERPTAEAQVLQRQVTRQRPTAPPSSAAGAPITRRPPFREPAVRQSAAVAQQDDNDDDDDDDDDNDNEKDAILDADDDDDDDDEDMDDLESMVAQLLKDEAQGKPTGVPELKKKRVAAPGSFQAQGKPMGVPPMRRRPMAAPGSFVRPGAAAGTRTRPNQTADQTASSSSQQPVVSSQPSVEVASSQPVAEARLSRPPSTIPSPMRDARIEPPDLDMPDEPEGEDTLDWKALEAFESFERYTDKLEEDEATAQVLVERAARQQAGSSMQTPAADSDPSSTSSPSPSLSARAKQVIVDAATSTSAEGDEATNTDAVDDLEQLVKFFELVEKQDSLEEGLEQGATASAVSKAEMRKMEASIDWSVIERLMIGDTLDAELEGMKEELMREAGIDPAMLEAEGLEDEGGDDGGEVAEPWADEVSSMLTSLILMSHRRYLDAPLLPADLPEEERANAVWNADFPVLVQDDSKEMALEYGNKKALEMLGWGFYDVFEKTSLDMVDADAVHQQNWIFSISDANVNFDKYVVLPEVKLRGAWGTVLSAKDVLVHRIDALGDGNSIGLAIIIRGPVVQA